jgi:hypothetical protein
VRVTPVHACFRGADRWFERPVLCHPGLVMRRWPRPHVCPAPAAREASCGSAGPIPFSEYLAARNAAARSARQHALACIAPAALCGQLVDVFA